MESGVTFSPKPSADAYGLKQLPLTLYNKNHITATGYSKVSRGLRFPLEIPGLCTRKECSGDSSLGQWRPRYTIHAGRHSNGKAFRSIFCQSLTKCGGFALRAQASLSLETFLLRLSTDQAFLLISSSRLEGRTLSYKLRLFWRISL